MRSPECVGQHIRKNGHRRGKQNYICVNCKHQFIETYTPRGYSSGIKPLLIRLENVC